MQEAVKKELLYDLTEAIKILETKEQKDFEQLKALSDHAIEDAAVHKDVDVIAITVLLYSLYKVVQHLAIEDYRDILKELQFARQHLEQNNLGKYNKSIKTSFSLIKESNVKIKEHLQDVMHAARIKKGTLLLQKGLSMGQAAGLMGLSNWDLQGYAAKTTAFEQHHEAIPAKKRMNNALTLFGL